jgi:hypothetical protein
VYPAGFGGVAWLLRLRVEGVMSAMDAELEAAGLADPSRCLFRGCRVCVVRVDRPPPPEPAAACAPACAAPPVRPPEAGAGTGGARLSGADRRAASPDGEQAAEQAFEIAVLPSPAEIEAAAAEAAEFHAQLAEGVAQRLACQVCS